MPRVHFRISSFLSLSIFPVLQKKRILSVRTQIVPVDRQDRLLAQLLSIAEIWIYQTKRTAFHLKQQLPFPVLQKIRTGGFNIQYSCRSIQSGRLKHILILPYTQRQRLHIVQRETTDIYLAGLAIAYRHSIVADCRMGSSHITDRNRFQPSRTSIVTHIRARETSHRIGHILNAQIVHHISSQTLHGNN